MEHKIKAIWHWNYYDGPINGLASYGGDKVWFTVKEIGGEDIERTFTVYSLLPNDLEELEREIKRFRDEIGYSNEHDPAFYKPKPMAFGTKTFKWSCNLDGLKDKPLFEVSKSDIENYSISRLL